MMDKMDILANEIKHRLDVLIKNVECLKSDVDWIHEVEKLERILKYVEASEEEIESAIVEGC